MRRSSWLFVGGAGTLVVGAIVLGLSLIPSPKERRKESLDDVRVEDLKMLKQGIMTYYHANGRLPESLDALPKWLGEHLADPVSGVPYEYIAKDLRIFQLCADFDTDSTGKRTPLHSLTNDWKHDKGRFCFADTDLLLQGAR